MTREEFDNKQWHKNMRCFIETEVAGKTKKSYGTINHHPQRKPDNEVLRKDGIVHTRTKQFCSDECYSNWNHDRQAKQYCNLRQHGRIHNNE
ncbi:MAG: hypothetical protein IKB96_11590 [Prevotella sp.]|nr:hypothetical protein [Prevotella sp.]